MCMHVVQQQASYHPTALLDHELLSTRVHATVASSRPQTFFIAGSIRYIFTRSVFLGATWGLIYDTAVAKSMYPCPSSWTRPINVDAKT